MNRYNTEIFKEKSTNKHGDRYDYSSSVYVNSHTEVIIICKLHGQFLQLPYIHWGGCGCRECADILTASKNASNIEEFTSFCNILYNNFYNYSKFIYVNSHTKGIVICPIHGEFPVCPSNHKNNHGCPDCGLLTTKRKTTKSNELYKEQCSKVHNNFYDYSITNYINSKTEVTVICPKHGPFKQVASDHLGGHGCPSCNASKGELTVKSWLNINKIEFIPQKKFDDCRNPKTNRKLKYDFYLPNENIIIEFDGVHHFECMYPHNESAFENVKYRDQIKNEYAIKNNIKLIRITYKQIKEIDNILNNELIITQTI